MNFSPGIAPSTLRERDHEEAIWRNFNAPDPEDYGYGGSDVESPAATERTSRYWMAASPGVAFKPRCGEGNADQVDDPTPGETTCSACWLIVPRHRIHDGRCNDCSA
jgi:hypothetical protein